MKRKKFIKQLMGCYYQDRNGAQSCAKAVQHRGGSYKDGLQEFDRIYRNICNGVLGGGGND